MCMGILYDIEAYKERLEEWKKRGIVTNSGKYPEEKTINKKIFFLRGKILTYVWKKNYKGPFIEVKGKRRIQKENPAVKKALETRRRNKIKKFYSDYIEWKGLEDSIFRKEKPFMATEEDFERLKELLDTEIDYNPKQIYRIKYPIGIRKHEGLYGRHITRKEFSELMSKLIRKIK